MEFTNEQIKALDFLKLAKVTYHKNMWRKNHELGYNTPGKPYDMIHIAADCPTDESKSIVLVHEVGHTYFNHVRVNVKKEILTVRNLFKKNKVNYSYIRLLGGPMSFLNICMDFEVNSKLLTFGNLRHMENNVGKLCVPENFSLDYQENFRDYYEPLIQYLKKRIEEEKQKAKERKEQEQQNQSQEDSEGEDSQDFGGSGSGSGMDIDNFEFSDSSDAEDLGDPDDYEDDEDFDEDEDSESSDSSNGESSDESDGEAEEDNTAETFDKDIPNFEDIEDMIKDMAKDLVDNDVSVFDDDFDEEIKKELQEESYDSAQDKEDASSDKSDNDTETTVGQAADELSDCPLFGDNSGTGERLDLTVETKENNARNIKNFLENIVRTTVDNYRLDYLKHLNRGTRDNSEGVLYSSLRNTMTLSKDKMGVLIDVSGSMDTSTILEGLKAIKEDAKKLNSDSTVVTWAVNKKEEFPLTNIPDYVDVGGGTYMDRGLDYLANVKKCNTILIYSDFLTDHDPLMIQAKKFKGNLYSIFVDFDSNNVYNNIGETFKDYIKLNKKVLYLKAKED